MHPDELRAAIAKPAEHAGRPLRCDGRSALGRGAQQSGALPLLEFALTRIWEGIERGEEPATLRQIRGVGDALAGEAQKISQDADERRARDGAAGARSGLT